MSTVKEIVSLSVAACVALLLGQGAAFGQAKCINAMVKDGAKVAATKGKDIGACLKSGGGASCVSTDSAKVGAAASKTSADYDKNCAAEPPTFGLPGVPSGTAAAISAAAVDEEEQLAFSIFGLGAATSGDKAGAKCQSTVSKTYEKAVATYNKGYGSCVKNALKAGGDEADLEACVLDDSGGKAAAALGKIEAGIGKACVGQSVSDLFPGSCADAPLSLLSECVAIRVRRHSCRMQNGMSGLQADCDTLDDGVPTDPDLSGTLFVTDDVGNKVYALDAASGDILASADTGEHPIGVEKANGKVYVANETDGTISVYDSATLSPRTVIPACEGPHHAAVSPDGSRFYAACLFTNKVAVVDTATDALVGLLTSGEPGARTHAPWPTRDGERLWVTNFETNDITEIDLQTGAILRTIPLGVQPNEVVVPANAKTAYISVPALGKMMVFDLETNQLVAEPAKFAPAFLMLSSDDKTILSSWAGLYNPTAVAIFDTETLTSVDVTLPGILATHTDFTPHAKFGFVSLVGVPQSGIAVVDIEKAELHDFYPIPGIAFIHAVRYAPGPP